MARRMTPARCDIRVTEEAVYCKDSRAFFHLCKTSLPNAGIPNNCVLVAGRRQCSECGEEIGVEVQLLVKLHG